jgi:pre-mRNA-splicing helicase BRR2
MQLPYLTKPMIERLADAKVEDIADFMNMDDDQREKLVPLPSDQMSEVARVCNRYPNIELLLSKSKLRMSSETDQLELVVTLKRDIEESDFDTKEEYL